MTEKMHNSYDRENYRHRQANKTNLEGATREQEIADRAEQGMKRHRGKDAFSTAKRDRYQQSKHAAEAAIASFNQAAGEHEAASEKIYLEHTGELIEAARAEAVAAGHTIEVTYISSPVEQIEVHRN